MPSAIESQVKKHVINQWLSGDSRDKIAADNHIGAGTVTNIINEWRKGIENSEYKSVRELALYSKKEGFGLSNYIQKLGANEDQIESFIANLANSPEPQKLIEVANQVAGLSRSESIPLEGLERNIKQEEEEKQTLEEEIKQRRAILDNTDVEIQTINEYKRFKEELTKHHLSSEDIDKLATVLNNIRYYGYDPRKIVAEFSNIKSITKLLRNAHRAPSAGHTQVQEFIIVKDRITKKKLRKVAVDQEYVEEAPTLIVVCSNTSRSERRYGRRGREFYSIIKGAFASMLILLTAVNERIGAGFVGAFDEEKVSEILKLPRYVRPVGIITLGYPSEREPVERLERLAIEDLIHVERW